MTAEELKELIGLGENSKVQFKEILDSPDSIAAELIAFANARGGVLIFGVKDKTGEITGLDFTALQTLNNKLSTIANESVKPPLFIITEAILVDEETGKKKVLIVSIGEGGNKPYKDRNGAIWMKQGADKRRLTDNDEIARLFQQSGRLYADEMEVAGTNIDDADERLFAAYFRTLFGQTYEEKHLSFEDALRVKRILRNGKLTLAGLLFFGRDPQAFKPSFTIKAVSYFGNDMAGTAYRSKPEYLTGTVPELFKQAMMYIKSNLRYLQQGQGFNSIGSPEISLIALEEVLQNALIHREYYKNAPVRLLVFDDRLEIISPGKLPNSLTVEEIKYGNPVTRNSLIAAFSTHTLPYSGLGSGLKRALENQPNIEFINDVEGEQFIVKIPRCQP
ncbi:MAG: putative DNA binding domain-containing protein [Candidatus Accumulibacter sp.]|jgi:predicted HTH transcriptional regulator|nr:putative DNA binding domain-containing protein [Accumulibacter sp.]